MYRKVLVIFVTLISTLVEAEDKPVCPFPDVPITFYFPHEDCTNFWQCSNGVPYLLHCPDGLVFNPESNVCDWVSNTPCNSENTTELLPSTVYPTQDTLRICPLVDGPDLTYFQDEDCSKFWLCLNGTLHLHNCSELTYFNPLVNVCNFSDTTRCTTDTAHDSESTKSASETEVITKNTFFVNTTSTVTTSDKNVSNSPITTKSTKMSTIWSSTEEEISDTPSTHYASFSAPSTDAVASTISSSKVTTMKVLATSSLVTTTSVADAHNNTLKTVKTSVTSFTSLFSKKVTMPGFVTSPKAKKTKNTSNATTPGDWVTDITEEPEDSNETTSDGSVSSTQTPKGKRTSATEMTTPDGSIRISQICENLPEDVFQAPHPFDCTKRLFCDHGEVTILVCPKGLWYNPYYRVCKKPEEAKCTVQSH